MTGCTGVVKAVLLKRPILPLKAVVHRLPSRKWRVVDVPSNWKFPDPIPDTNAAVYDTEREALVDWRARNGLTAKVTATGVLRD